MIGRSNHFADIVCPFDDQGCARPYCHFWHSKDEGAGRQTLYATSVSAAQPGPSFMGYVGYVGNDVSQIPDEPPVVIQPNVYEPTNGYVGSIASTSAAALPSETMYKASVDTSSKERPRKRIPSPDESLNKPKAPVELAVDDILDPNMDEKIKKEEEKKEEVVAPAKGKNLHDIVKSVAAMDTRIEELQKAIEQHKKEKERMISEFKNKAKHGSNYVSSKKTSSKKSSTASSKLPAYSGGYTPTPIAVLKSKAEKKNKVQSESVEDADEIPSTSKAVKAKEPLEKRLSIEELFDEEPPAKKCRTYSVGRKESETKPKLNCIAVKSSELSTKSLQNEKTATVSAKTEVKKAGVKNGSGSELTVDQVKAAKKRIASATTSTQSYFQRANLPGKRHTTNVAQQLVYRYEKLQKEKEEIMKKVQEKSAHSSTLRSSEEDELNCKPSGSGSIAKGEKRVAHAANFSKPGTVKLMPLDPCSSSKIPYTLRMRYLDMFYTEFLKITQNQSEATLQAQEEEKVLKDKAVTKGGYTSSAVNVLRRLREATKGMTVTNLEAKSVSHTAVLEGKHHGSITVGKRKHVAVGSRVLNESEFYDALQEKYVLSMEQLEKNGFPLWKDKEKTAVKIVASERDARKKMFVPENDLKRICCRCGAEFRLTPNLEYAAVEQCIYHWGRAYKTRTQGSWESRYSCCSSDLTVKGCCVADFHVTDSACLSELQSFIETPSSTGPTDLRNRRVYAVDCEMVYTTRGLSLARISLVDTKDDLALDCLVRPRYPIVDCNTRFSGLTKEQLEKAEYSFEEAQQRLFKYVNSETILIGHSLESDLKAMKLVHHNVVDTSVVYPHRLGPPYKRALKTIASEVLQLIIQEDVTGHDSKEDSSACMRLMLHKIKQG